MHTLGSFLVYGLDSLTRGPVREFTHLDGNCGSRGYIGHGDGPCSSSAPWPGPCLLAAPLPPPPPLPPTDGAEHLGLAPSPGASSGCCPNGLSGAGEDEEASGAIRAGNHHSHPLRAPSDQDWCWAPAAGPGGGFGAGCRCEWGRHWLQVRAGPALTAGVSGAGAGSGWAWQLRHRQQV